MRSSAAPAGADYEYIAGGDAFVSGTDGILTIGILSDKSGTFSISSMAGYTALALGLKDGNLDGLQWGVMLLTNVLSGTWGLYDSGGKLKDLSHPVLYGIACTPETCPTHPGGSGEVPLPSALLLFASALAGMGLICARRRRRA